MKKSKATWCLSFYLDFLASVDQSVEWNGIVSDSNNFYDINQKILTKKKVISKISVDTNFMSTSYAWLCALEQ